MHLPNALPQSSSGKRVWPRRKQRRPNKANVSGVKGVLDGDESILSVRAGTRLVQGKYSDGF